MLPVADATRAVPTIGAIAARTPRTCSGSTLGLARRFEVQRIRDRRGIDRDERSDANEQQCFPVETRRSNGVCGHAREQVEDRGIGGRISHGASFRSKVALRSMSVGAASSSYRWHEIVFRERTPSGRPTAPPSRAPRLVRRYLLSARGGCLDVLGAFGVDLVLGDLVGLRERLLDVTRPSAPRTARRCPSCPAACTSSTSALISFFVACGRGSRRRRPPIPAPTTADARNAGGKIRPMTAPPTAPQRGSLAHVVGVVRHVDLAVGVAADERETVHRDDTHRGRVA